MSEQTPEQNAPATDGSELSSPVPAPDTTPAPAPAASDQPAAPAVSPAPAALAVGDLASYTVTDADGFESELTCLVTEAFDHPDADGTESSHARVIVLPPANVIEASRLTRRD